jgi:hypothetical protein
MGKIAIVLILAVATQGLANAAEGTRSLLPPLVPSADEQPILAVPLFNVQKSLEACLDDAKAGLNKSATPAASVDAPHFALNRHWGYLLRADFVRADVAPPSVNRIVCWQDGQIVAAKLVIPPLGPVAASHPLAVPGRP